MKMIAMYLPQFHRTAENDEWWGEGFTEWTTVRNAKPIYEGHIQPREPLNEYYYNLLQRDTMEWQAALAEEYEIFGFCFYHYWFKDGRRILEKPAENLLKWKDINMRFSFCWANESWARTWSKEVFKNSWSNKFEKDSDTEKGNDILLDQKYGRESDWKEHFDYLLDFFKDERYIRIDDKPIFNIYKPEQISCLEDMLEKWNEWAVEEGLKGIYIIIHNSLQIESDIVNAYYIHQPAYVRSLYGEKLLKKKTDDLKWDRIYSYEDTWEHILKQKYIADKPVFEGGFVDYDDTPRHLYGGFCYEGGTPEKFKEYLEKLVMKNLEKGIDFVFINAWNEWGEGMYLEPDKKNGFGYLESISEVMKKYKNKTLEPVGNAELESDSKHYKELYEEKVLQHKKFKEYFDILNRWMYLKESKKSLEEFFVKNEYKRIGIYGLGHLGRHLMEELNGTEIKVEYFIDRRGGVSEYDIQVLKPDEILPEVDAIIVTATFEYNVIKKKIKTRLLCPVISLKEVILEV